MVAGGFAIREVPSSDAFAFYFAKQFVIPESLMAGHIVVRAMPSRTSPNDYVFDTTLMWQGEALPSDLQPAAFVGSVRDFLSRHVTIAGIVITIYDLRKEVENESSRVD